MRPNTDTRGRLPDAPKAISATIRAASAATGIVVPAAQLLRSDALMAAAAILYAMTGVLFCEGHGNRPWHVAIGIIGAGCLAAIPQSRDLLRTLEICGCSMLALAVFLHTDATTVVRAPDART